MGKAGDPSETKRKAKATQPRKAPSRTRRQAQANGMQQHQTRPSQQQPTNENQANGALGATTSVEDGPSDDEVRDKVKYLRSIVANELEGSAIDKPSLRALASDISNITSNQDGLKKLETKLAKAVVDGANQQAEPGRARSKQRQGNAIFLDGSDLDLGEILPGDNWKVCSMYQNEGRLNLHLVSFDGKRKRQASTAESDDDVDDGSAKGGQYVEDGVLGKKRPSDGPPAAKRRRFDEEQSHRRHSSRDTTHTGRNETSEDIAQTRSELANVDFTSALLAVLLPANSSQGERDALHTALTRAARQNNTIVLPWLNRAFTGPRRWGFDQAIPETPGEWQFMRYGVGEGGDEDEAATQYGRAYTAWNVHEAHAQGHDTGIVVVWVPKGVDTDVDPLSALQVITVTNERGEQVRMDENQPDTVHITLCRTENRLEQPSVGDEDRQNPNSTAPNGGPTMPTEGQHWRYASEHERKKTLTVDQRPENNRGLVIGGDFKKGRQLRSSFAEKGEGPTHKTPGPSPLVSTSTELRPKGRNNPKASANLPPIVEEKVEGARKRGGREAPASKKKTATGKSAFFPGFAGKEDNNNSTSMPLQEQRIDDGEQNIEQADTALGQQQTDNSSAARASPAQHVPSITSASNLPTTDQDEAELEAATHASNNERPESESTNTRGAMSKVQLDDEAPPDSSFSDEKDPRDDAPKRARDDQANTIMPDQSRRSLAPSAMSVAQRLSIVRSEPERAKRTAKPDDAEKGREAKKKRKRGDDAPKREQRRDGGSDPDSDNKGSGGISV